jgi:mannitol-1-/sugar-/sorbitol-6-phosphatase
VTEQVEIQAVLFDMDGVVADTQDAITAFWHDVAAAHGIALTQDDFHRNVYGVPASHTLDALFPWLDEQGRESVLKEMYAGEAAGPYRAIAGALQLLCALREEDIPTALVTSAQPVKVDAVSGALGLEGLFVATVTRDEIRSGKPDPEGYLLAAARIGVDPVNCLVLEDAVSGVQAAVAAGCACVGVTDHERAGELFAEGAIAVVPDLRAISVDCSDGIRALQVSETRFRLPG